MPVRLIVGMLRDKDPVAFIKNLEPLKAIEVIAVGVQSERAWSAEELGERWQTIGLRARKAQSWSDAEQMIRADAQPGELTVVTGSLYLAGEARKALKKL
jgi:folylpolyglutamate synthase/dihydropteroate synthase